MELAALWDHVLEAMRRRIGSQDVEVWLKGARAVHLDGEVLLLEVANRYYADWIAETKECREGGQGSDVYFSRGYFVRMRGPDYFALLVSEELSCGGAHPSNALTPITYDIATGQRVNWPNLFGAEAKVRRAYEPEPGERPTDLFASPVLHAIYLKQVRAGRAAAGR